MACGGFTCSKNALAALNVLYIMVAFILIGVAGYVKAVAIITSIGIMGGIIACGVFLLLIAIVGLVGAIKHHQVLLFFYMIILFLLFLLQFSIACACLAMNDTQRESLLKNGWRYADNATQEFTQEHFQCCAFDARSQNYDNATGPDDIPHPPCSGVPACHVGKTLEGPVVDASCCLGPQAVNVTISKCPADPCMETMRDKVRSAVKAGGGVGLFFSFTEIIGVWLALRFRNQKDPRANPSAFL